MIRPSAAGRHTLPNIEILARRVGSGQAGDDHGRSQCCGLLLFRWLFVPKVLLCLLSDVAIGFCTINMNSHVVHVQNARSIKNL